MLNTLKHSLTAVALLAATSSAMASAVTWNDAKKWDIVGTATTATSVNTSAFSNGQGTPANPTTIQAAPFSAAKLNDHGKWGFGILSTNEANIKGPHGADNGHGIDAYLLNFDSAVNLSHLKFGWAADGENINTDNNGGAEDGGASINYNDSDLSVFAWTGQALAAGETMSSKMGAINPTNITASGWTLIGNYANAGKNKDNILSISSPATTFSSFWLVSAYSNAFGSGVGLNQGDDAFKLDIVAGTVCTKGVNCSPNHVPEPSSLALLGAALSGFLVIRRRANKS